MQTHYDYITNTDIDTLANILTYIELKSYNTIQRAFPEYLPKITSEDFDLIWEANRKMLGTPINENDILSHENVKQDLKKEIEDEANI